MKAIEKVNRLNESQKQKVYAHYLCTMLGMKHDFEIVDKTKPNWQHGRDEPHKEYPTLALYFLWKDTRILTFAEFTSDSNIKVTDCGKDWKEQMLAQRWRVELSGIYDWYWKHEDSINLKQDK